MAFDKRDLEFYKTMEGIKKVTRFEPFKPLHENVAGHCFMAVFLANDIMDRYELNLDKNLVLKMLMVHDLPEIGMNFDFPADVLACTPGLKEKKKELETMQVYSFSNKYNRPQIKSLFNEFDDHTSREAIFANLVDKIEAALYILTNKCAGFSCNDDFEFILHYPDKYADHFPELSPLINSIKEGLQKEYDKFKAKSAK